MRQSFAPSSSSARTVHTSTKMVKTLIGRFAAALWVVAVTGLASPLECDAQSKVSVVTTIPDLASIVNLIGGDRVETFAIATGYQNPHFVDPKPSYIMRLSRADMFVTVGLDLETGWVVPLLNSARNGKIMQGGPGYVDASKGVSLLQVPTNLSREQGDIHVYGNPHYWLDFERGKIVARNIFDALVRLRPQDRSYFESNLAAFVEHLDSKGSEWLAKLEPYKGASIIAYHNEWPYFEERFGLRIAEFLEPKPGIPPSPSQLARVIGLMKREDIRVIITSPYFKKDAAELVARKTGGVVITLATLVGAEPEIRDYFDLFDYNVTQLVDAFGRVGVSTGSSD